MFYRHCRKLCFIPLFCFAAALLSCAKSSQPPVPRVAVLAFDNLSTQASLDWMNRAAASALVDQLTGVKNLTAIPADTLQNAYSLRAGAFLHTYFISPGGRLEAHATLEDAHTHKSSATFSATGPADAGILPLIDRIAHQLSPDAKPYSTRNPAAFRAFADGLAASTADARNQAFEAATRADSNYSAAYIVWAEGLLQAGDREGLARVISAGEQDHPSAIDRARLEYLAATGRRDVAAQFAALKKLAALSPSDPQLFRRLAEIETVQRKFQDAVHDYETVARLNPDDEAVFNSLGYARAWAGDLAGARRSLAEYQKRLPPQDVNALDSLGEVNFFFGDFRAAESNFEMAHQRNPGGLGGVELLKAAQARLMTGDLAGADAIFRRYENIRRQLGTPLGDFQSAQWLFLTGRRKEAIASLEKLGPALSKDASAGAFCQLSIWRLQTGDAIAAASDAGQAAQRAVSPAMRSMSALCRFLTQGSSPTSGSKLADAYALLFEQKFAAAAPLLEALYHETGPNNDGEVRVLLAWTKVEKGNVKEAEALLGLYPIPLASGDTIFASLIFPRIFYLRGAVLASQGKAEEAKRNFQLYVKLAGDLPDIFGDIKKAREALQ